MKKILATLIAVLMLTAAVLPTLALAEAVQDYPDKFGEIDREKLSAFWCIENEAGVCNGDAVFEPIPAAPILVGPSQLFYSHGSYYTPMISSGSSSQDRWSFDFFFEVGYCVEFDDGLTAIAMEEIRGDLHGCLDLAETNLGRMASPAENQTHISGLVLDDCANLEAVQFNSQQYVEEISALNCPKLSEFSALNCGSLKRIAVMPVGFDTAIEASSFGSGSVGIKFRSSESKYALHAYGDNFIGWYVNGELISRDDVLMCGEAVKAIACFADDVTGDGVINVQDAVATLRFALGIAELGCPECFADANGDGEVTVADAVQFMRSALMIG